MRRYLILIGLGVVVGLALVAAVAMNQPYALHGSVIQEPSPAPDFTLPDARDGQFHLSDQKGQVVLMFFGYTACPDVCPTTLADLKQVHQRLGKDADRLRVVFVTVDPDRDTPEKTAAYAATFDPSFTGLSAPEAQLAPVWKAYGAYRQLEKSSPDDKAYAVTHSTQLYLVDPSGNLRLTYAYGTPVDDILQDVRYLLKQR